MKRLLCVLCALLMLTSAIAEAPSLRDQVLEETLLPGCAFGDSVLDLRIALLDGDLLEVELLLVDGTPPDALMLYDGADCVGVAQPWPEYVGRYLGYVEDAAQHTSLALVPVHQGYEDGMQALIAETPQLMETSSVTWVGEIEGDQYYISAFALYESTGSLWCQLMQVRFGDALADVIAWQAVVDGEPAARMTADAWEGPMEETPFSGGLWLTAAPERIVMTPITESGPLSAPVIELHAIEK